MRRLIVAFLALPLLAAAGSCQDESLLIGPGDLLQVEVMDTPDMQQQARVTDSGVVPLAYIGEVPVSGKTPAAAAQAIEQTLVAKDVMKHPHVTVRVQEYATQSVSVLGQVRNPGSYAITTSQSVLKVLSMAGGLTDMADRHISIRRHGSAKETVTYYVSNDSEKALADAVLVHPGDTVLVPRADLVYVMGDVGRPGGYAISSNDSHVTVLQALTLAGSENKTAVRSHVRLIRNTSDGHVEIPVRLDKIEKGEQPDLTLQANDVLFVPFSWMKNIAVSSSTIASSTASAAVYAVH